MPWLMHAIHMTLFANANRGKDQRPFTLDDWMPHAKEEEEVTTAEQAELWLGAQLQGCGLRIVDTR